MDRGPCRAVVRPPRAGRPRDVPDVYEAFEDAPETAGAIALAVFAAPIFTRLPFAVLGGGVLPAIADKQTRSYVAVRVDVAGTDLVVVGMQLATRSPEQITALLDAWGGASPAIGPTGCS